ncbi:inositol monophosphatase [Alicyclobacillus curvatus]|nr:inositol monophosphatase [Alicyclobacillus curvatus]
MLVLIQASVAAGRYFAAQVDGDKVVTEKTSAADVVTQVDKASEKVIRDLIQSTWPDDEMLGEEGTDPGSDAAKTAVAAVGGAPHLWIIDPLDGTTNFVSKIPLSVVSLAYASRGQVMLGAVYDPYRDELFYAVRGQGAWLSSSQVALSPSGDELPGKRLQVSDIGDLRLSVVASGFPTRADDREAAMQNGMKIVRKAKSLRGFGAAALHLAYVAAGRLEGFWEYDLNAWDIAAGSLLVSEAGGVVSDIDGSPYDLAVRNVVACGQPDLANDIGQFLEEGTRPKTTNESE